MSGSPACKGPWCHWRDQWDGKRDTVTGSRLGAGNTGLGLRRMSAGQGLGIKGQARSQEEG